MARTGLGRGLGNLIPDDDSTVKKSTAKSTRVKSSTTKSTSTKTTTAKEKATKTTTAKEKATKATTAKEKATKATTAKEKATKATTAKEKEIKATTVKEKKLVKKLEPKLSNANLKAIDSEKKVTKLEDKTTAKNPVKKEKASERKVVKKKEEESKTVVETVIKSDTYLRVSDIEPNRNQPRKHFDKEALEELAASIKNYGLIQPIIVQKRDGYYEIIAGERRWRAAKIAKIKEVPVIIKDYTEREIMEIALIENIQREDLNPIEEAESYNRLIEEYDLLQEELAQRLSKSRSAITNSLRLLKLSDKVRELVVTAQLSGGHARALIPVEDETLQLSLAMEIVNNKLSVRDTERLVKRALNKKPAKEVIVDDVTEIVYKNMENKLKDILATKVNIIRKKNGKGKIEIDYYSQEELDRIMDIIQR